MKSIRKYGYIVVLTAIIFTHCDKNNMINDWENEDTDLSPTIEFTADEQKVLWQMRNKDNKIDMEEALLLVHEVIGFLDGESATKSGASRKIASVVALRGEKEKKVLTKSTDNNVQVEMPDTLAYLFNFADDAGYTIIAADTRVENPVLCYTGAGTLGDTITNPGIALFLEGAEYYMERSIIEAEQMRDSLIADILAKMDETGVKDTIYVDEVATKTAAAVDLTYNTEPEITYSYGPWAVASRVGPLLPVEWDQGPPYNMLVPHTCSTVGSGGKAWAGCVATATAQVMAYWKYPNSIDGYTFDWNVLRQYTAIPYRYDGVGTKEISYTPGVEADQTRQQIARLMERIGSHIKMNWGCDSSGAETTEAATFLRGRGYSGGYIEDYSVTSVLNSLNSNRPVLAQGYDTKIDTHHSTFFGIITWTTTDYKGGHAWVMDGYLRKHRQVTVTVTTYNKPTPGPTKAASNFNTMLIRATTTSTYTEYSPYYIHQNWGWSGSANGYYVAGTFDSNNRSDLPSNTKSRDPYNFQYKNKILPNIRR